MPGPAHTTATCTIRGLPRVTEANGWPLGRPRANSLSGAPVASTKLRRLWCARVTHGVQGATHGVQGVTHGALGVTHGALGVTHGAQGVTHGAQGARQPNF